MKITVDYTTERTDSLSLDSLAEISGAISSALDRADEDPAYTSWRCPRPVLPAP